MNCIRAKIEAGFADYFANLNVIVVKSAILEKQTRLLKNKFQKPFKIIKYFIF